MAVVWRCKCSPFSLLVALPKPFLAPNGCRFSRVSGHGQIRVCQAMDLERMDVKEELEAMGLGSWVSQHKRKRRERAEIRGARGLDLEAVGFQQRLNNGMVRG